MKRFWLAVAKFAARRAGSLVVRPNREVTDAEWAAYADEAREWAEASMPLAAEVWPTYGTTTTTTLGGANITWNCK